MVPRSFLRLAVLVASSAALLARSSTVSFFVVRSGPLTDGSPATDEIPGLVTATASFR